MKKLLIPAATAIALVFSVGMAAADEISGRVTAINSEAMTLTLENGMTFNIGQDVSLEGLKAGDEVKVTFEEEEGKKIATEVSRPQN